MSVKISPPQLISFESLFKNKKFIIPHYQRDYIWKEDNWIEWLKDIENLIDCEDIDEIHFVGCVICKKNPKTDLSYSEYLIIDGQQRITTFFVFSSVILELLEESNSKNNLLSIENIKQLLFLPNKGEPRISIRGGKENSLRGIYEHKNPEDKKEQILKAYQWFKKQLGNKTARKHLDDYFKNLKDRVKFVSIELGEKENALEVFKSINASGVVLTSADLIKAEFFILYEEKGPELCDKLFREWEEMKEKVGKENINHFFYTFLCTKFKKTNEYSEKVFYTFFKEKLLQKKEEKEKIEELWSEIIKKSEIYGQILNPQLDYWGEHFYSTIQEIKILGVNQLYPLIIVLKAKGLQSKIEADILQKLVIYSFRKKTKGKVFSKSDVLKWCWEIQNDQVGRTELILNDSGIIEEIKKSDIFWDELEEKQNFTENEIKWLLTKLYLKNHPEGYFLFTSLQLEHMFPKKPNKEWWLIPEWKELKEDEEKIKEKLYSLGNTTLLTPGKNIAASNKAWKEKREEFRKKTCLGREKNDLNLLEKSVLLPKDIDDRKKWLIQQFKKTDMLFINEEKEKTQIE